MAGIRCIAIRRHDAFLKKFKAISITYSNCTIRVVRFLQGINRTDHCRILRNFSRKNKDFKYKIVRNFWNPTAFFFKPLLRNKMKTPLTSLVSASSSLKPMKKRNHFGKVKAALANGSDVVTISVDYTHLPLALSVNWNWFFADASFRFYLDGCRFFYHNDNSVPFSLPKWPAQMASIIWFSFTSCALYGMDISHDAALHSRTKSLQIWIPTRVYANVALNVHNSHIGIGHTNA